MQIPRPARAEPVIERPPPLPWVGDLPVPQPGEWEPGTLLSWRWFDKDAGLWIGVVRCQRDGLIHEHEVSGELLTVVAGDK